MSRSISLLLLALDRFRKPTLIAGLVLLCAAMQVSSQQPTQTILSERIELARLVDLCAQRLNLNIQYDQATLKGTLTLRLGAGVTDEKLWALTNRLLASRGFTSVQMPGEDTLSIVRLTEAATLARVEEDLATSVAGYVKILHELEYKSPDQVQLALGLVLSKPGGIAAAVGKTDMLMLSDLKPQIEQALQLLQLLDVPPGASITEEIQPEHVTAKTLATLVGKVATQRGAVIGKPLTGKLLELEAGRGLLLVAPAKEESTWRNLIALLDQPEGLETVTYQPETFSIAEVGKLVTDIVAGAGADSGWRMVNDELTGSLVITATPSQHREIAALMARLSATPSRDAVIEEIPAKNVDPPVLVALVEKVAASRGAVVGKKATGKIMPGPGGNSVLLIAPADELAFWRDLVARLDQAEPQETVSYSPKHFALREVGNLIEEIIKASGHGGPGEGWRLVTDELTGTLIVTATPSQHERIAKLIERLDSVAPASRRPMRSFVVRNRRASELVELIGRLVGAGALGTDAGAQSDVDNNRMPTDQISSVEPPVSSQNQVRSARADAAAVGFKSDDLSITADDGTNTLIAIGEAALLDQLEGMLKTLDVRQSQVMLEVLVVSLSETQTRDLGVALRGRITKDDRMIDLASLFGIGAPDVVTGELGGVGNGLSGVVLDPGEFSAVVQALETVNEGRTLNRPKLLVNNNQKATLDSVLQTPFSSVNATNTIATTSFGGTLDAGTTLTVTPQIAEGDHLVLEYSVNLSSFTGESIDPALPPPRQQNSLQSVVTIPDGHTIVLGGLDVETKATAKSRVPFLGSIPLLGWLFQSHSTSTIHQRLFVFIRANVMRHAGFEDLKYLTRPNLEDSGLDDGWPTVEPRWIR